MDAARTARRLGADEAMIVYRRDRAHMPAHDFEADEALAEGVKIKWLTSIKAIDGGDLTVELMRIDANGRAQPTGEFETLKADAVVLALGQDADSGFLRKIPEIVHPGRRHGGGRAGHDDRPARASSPAATWCRRSARSRSPPATARRRRATSTPGCAATIYSRPRQAPDDRLRRLNLPIYSDAARSAEHELPVGAPRAASMRWSPA